MNQYRWLPIVLCMAAIMLFVASTRTNTRPATLVSTITNNGSYSVTNFSVTITSGGTLTSSPASTIASSSSTQFTVDGTAPITVSISYTYNGSNKTYSGPLFGAEATTGAMYVGTDGNLYELLDGGGSRCLNC